MRPRMRQPGRWQRRMASGARRRVAAGVVVAVVGPLLGGCQGETPDSPGRSSELPSLPSVAGSPSPGPQDYQIPAWQEICAAARTTGLKVKKTEKDSDSPQYQTGCRIHIGGSTQIASATVTFEANRRAAQAFEIQKNDDWNKGFAFSGPARDKAVVQQVGSTKLGRDYDDAYYAFFDKVKVAGSTNSKTNVVILRGNALISFSVNGAEWHGAKPKTVKGLTPLKPEFGKDAVDKMADAMLALLKPAPR